MIDSEIIRKWDESKVISKEINVKIEINTQIGVIKLIKDNDLFIQSECIHTIHAYLLGLKKGLIFSCS